MKSVIHMHNGDLFDEFGEGLPGKRVIDSNTVQWLLTDPTPVQVATRRRGRDHIKQEIAKRVAAPFRDLGFS